MPRRRTTKKTAPASPPIDRAGVSMPACDHDPVSAPARPIKAAYFNRELSWLAFNRRVLEQARNPSCPLLERVKFLAIVCSNLDEFFEIRVAGLIQQVESGVEKSGLDGLGPREQLRRIHSVVASLVDDQYRLWHDELVPALAAEGVHFKSADELTSAELAWVRHYFDEQVFPVLTPLGLDQAHPFPQVGNKTLNVVVSLDDPDTPENERHAAILPVPRILPRLVRIDPDGTHQQTYIFLSEIIKLCADAFFPGYRLNGAHAFRVTRNSDLYIDEEEAENLLQTIEAELRNLKRGAAVRLEIEEGVDDEIFETLCNHLELSHEYVFRLGGPLNLLRLMSLVELDRPDLKYPNFTPVSTSPLHAGESPFATLAQQDVLLHHPYDSFEPVVDFVTLAARDPQVFAMKQTLYRTSGDSPIVRALIEASKNGKQVTALVELKARFDEANNIQWARQLEDAGVHVVYGLVGHKTHCKCSLVVRREGKVLRRYAHLGTGNYNPKTAKLYTDLSLFTSRPDITEDVATTFNTLTGFSRKPTFQRLLVAPFNLHSRLLDLIDRETANAAAGKPARIIAKMNSLIDKAVIDRLYAASRAGVQIDLIIRGICGLVPGMRGLSENIRVRSIVGRFLEHVRAFYFHNADGEPDIYAGSADWMPRNFFRRIEVIFPIDDPQLRAWFLDELFPLELQDNVDARELRANGSYRPVPRRAGEPTFSVQTYFMAAAGQRVRYQNERDSLAL
ncbi:polyphosphate kinase 1 [Actomonas aquatica]|uniref:Polyphosphate kinase n=1 Tax=Actomonas aquatica TaxID=2866162 RepID=A0ABZ1CDM1_9BACT|nr:polyphosphate kinase 1 [Opitutus sp. WL0086]WRQ89521.1 polyphosphate kinase 1 [Opitutus sp. WL0086]